MLTHLLYLLLIFTFSVKQITSGFLPVSAVVIITLHLWASQRFPGHLMQQPARAALTRVEARLPSIPSLSHSRAAGRALPATREETDDKLEVRRRKSTPAINKSCWCWPHLVILPALQMSLVDNQPWCGVSALFKMSLQISELGRFLKLLL